MFSGNSSFQATLRQTATSGLFAGLSGLRIGMSENFPYLGKKITLEKILKLKRQERPSAEFWEEFDRDLRRRTLQALVNAQPWHLDYILNLDFDVILYNLKFMLPFFFYYSLINVFFISGLIILFASNFQKKIDNYTKIINYYFFFNIILIFCIYLTGDLEIEYLVKNTMERIIFTISGFYVFFIVNFVKNLNKNFVK